MHSGATSRSTACRSMPTASCTITSAALRTSRQSACALSAIRTSGSPRITCVSSASSACTPPMVPPSPTAPDIWPALPDARALLRCRRSACARSWSSSWSPRARRRLYRLGEDGYRNRLLLAWARAGEDADDAHWRELATLPQRWSAPKFPLKAADFMARGIAEGPVLGQALALAEDAWLAADFPLDLAAVKDIADQTVTRFTRDIRP